MKTKTAILTGNTIFGGVCFVLSSIGNMDGVTAASCAAILMLGWSGLMLILSKPIDGAGL